MFLIINYYILMQVCNNFSAYLKPCIYVLLYIYFLKALYPIYIICNFFRKKIMHFIEFKNFNNTSTVI